MSNLITNEQSNTVWLRTRLSGLSRWIQTVLKWDRPNGCIKIEQCIRHVRLHWNKIPSKSCVLFNWSQKKKPQWASGVHSSVKLMTFAQDQTGASMNLNWLLTEKTHQHIWPALIFHHQYKVQLKTALLKAEDFFFFASGHARAAL